MRCNVRFGSLPAKGELGEAPSGWSSVNSVQAMSKVREAFTPELKEWIAEQKIFFVATAPRSDAGHLNCSPKGGDSFRVLNDHEVAYIDLTGSGIETIAHLQENGRIVVMFCAFHGPPKIVRLYGQGVVLYPEQPEFTALAKNFPHNSGTRAIIRINVSRIADSCGLAVPLFDFVASRDKLDKWSQTKQPAEIAAYRQKKNKTSIDGIPGYRA